MMFYVIENLLMRSKFFVKVFVGVVFSVVAEFSRDILRNGEGWNGFDNSGMCCWNKVNIVVSTNIAGPTYTDEVANLTVMMNIYSYEFDNCKSFWDMNLLWIQR